MTNNDVTIIIPTLNRIDSLRETLNSYLEGTIVPRQIVIVDQTENESLREKMRDMVLSYKDKTEITYVSQKIASLTVARNTGLSEAKHDIVVFSDDDVSINKNTIEAIVNIMGDDTVSMIAGINSNDVLSKSKLGYIFCKKSYKKRNCGHVTKAMLGRFPQYEIKSRVSTEWAMGFFFVIRKHLVSKWDVKWDENLTGYAYAEDLDFSSSYYEHSLEENMKCIMDPQIAVNHRESLEYRVPSVKSTMMYVLNRYYLSYKHKKGIISRIAITWSDFGDIIYRLCKKENPRAIITGHLVYMKHRKQIKKGIICPEWYGEGNKK